MVDAAKFKSIMWALVEYMGRGVMRVGKLSCGVKGRHCNVPRTEGKGEWSDSRVNYGSSWLGVPDSEDFFSGVSVQGWGCYLVARARRKDLQLSVRRGKIRDIISQIGSGKYV